MYPCYIAFTISDISPGLVSAEVSLKYSKLEPMVTLGNSLESWSTERVSM